MSAKALVKEQEDSTLDATQIQNDSANLKNSSELGFAHNASELNQSKLEKTQEGSLNEAHANASSKATNNSLDEVVAKNSIPHVITSSHVSSDKAAANEASSSNELTEEAKHQEKAKVQPYVFKPTYKEEEKSKLDPFSALLIRALSGGYGEAHYGTSLKEESEEEKPSQEALALRAAYKNTEQKLDNPSLMKRVKSGFVADQNDLYARNHQSYASNRRDNENHPFVSSVATVISALEAKNLETKEQAINHHDQYSKSATAQASAFSQKANQALHEMYPHHHNIGPLINDQYRAATKIKIDDNVNIPTDALQQAYAKGYAAARSEQLKEQKLQDKAEFEKAYKSDSLTSLGDGDHDEFLTQDVISYDDYDENYLDVKSANNATSLLAQAAQTSR